MLCLRVAFFFFFVFLFAISLCGSLVWACPGFPGMPFRHPIATHTHANTHSTALPIILLCPLRCARSGWPLGFWGGDRGGGLVPGVYLPSLPPPPPPSL
uniref:Putative secreted protein n=1 Tax=Anopheles darlingi TaxID=43151 RepID=A0A2M4DIR3_ANODA